MFNWEKTHPNSDKVQNILDPLSSKNVEKVHNTKLFQSTYIQLFSNSATIVQTKKKNKKQKLMNIKKDFNR